MKSVFITGANGLLGTNLTHALIGRGFNIYALIRKENSYKGKRSGNLKLITMDLWGDYSYLLKKTEIVVHMAADSSTNKINYSDYETINYKATKRLFDLAKANGVKRFIYISTANTIGYGDLKNPGTENSPVTSPFNQLFYAQSKIKAERYLLRNRKGIDLRILNPTFMIGPFDSKPSSGIIVKMTLGKRWVFYPPGGKNFVPVKDVVQAILNSFENGESGEKYLIAGENLSYKTFFNRLRKISGEKQTLIPLPGWLFQLLGYFGNILRRIGISTSLSSVNMKILCVNNFYDNHKSIEKLQVEYSSLDHAMREAVHYFRGQY